MMVKDDKHINFLCNKESLTYVFLKDRKFLNVIFKFNLDLKKRIEKELDIVAYNEYIQRPKGALE